MPRLQQIEYLDRHHLLRLLWREYPQVYAVLSVREQRQLHRYYQTQSDECDHCLVVGRRRITLEDPALPHVASKAFHALLSAFRLADNYAGEDDVAFNRVLAALARTETTHKVTVSAVAQPTIDLELLARAVMRIAADIGREDSAA